MIAVGHAAPLPTNQFTALIASTRDAHESLGLLLAPKLRATIFFPALGLLMSRTALQYFRSKFVVMTETP